MADEIKKDSAEAKAKKTKSASKEKKPNVFVRMGKGIKKFFKDLRGECKKIVWPDSKTVLKSSAVVIVAVVLIGAVIWLIDTGLSEIIKLLVNLASDDAETTTAAAGAILTNFFGV